MAQITIYLEEVTEKKLRSVAKKAGLSVSRWLADLINRAVSKDWPQSVVNAAGSWQNFPSLEEIRKTQGTDHKRETF